MNTGIFGEGFPYSNFHDLNMDWIIKIAKDFLDQYTRIQDIIEQGKTDITNLTNTGLEELQTKYETLEALLNEWYATHSADIADQLASALADLNSWYTTHSGDIADQLASALADLNSTLQTNITAFDNHAEEKAQEVIASIPADYTELADEVANLGELDKILTKQASFDVERNLNYFDDGSALSGDGWYNNHLYGAGYVKSIKFRTRASGSGYVAFVFIDPVSKKVLDKISAFFTNAQELTFPVNRAYEQEFYIGVIHASAVDVNYKSNENVISYYFGSNNVDVGSTISPTQYGTYEFPFIVNYESADVNLGQLLSKNYGQITTMTINNIPIADITGTPDGTWWASEFHYKAGYVKQIKVHKDSANAISEIIILDTVTNIVLFKGTTASDSDTIIVEQYMPNDFYIFDKHVCYDTKYTSYERYTNNSAMDTIRAGSAFTPTFNDGRYIFANEVTYELTDKQNLELKIIDRNKMFACGDSITAGFPYIANNDPYKANEDLRWGRQVARRLGFDITFGAQSGNGWVYSTGSANAYTITRDTDFSTYHVAVYAWGTNDYGHDSPLGDITDDPSQTLTVCSRIKWCIEKIYTDNPAIILILVLPINRMTGLKANNYAYGTANGAGYTLSDLCEKMKQICVMYGIPYIDPRVSPFNRYTIDGLTVDGLHPNFAGYMTLGSYLTGQIGSIISPYYANAYTSIKD